MFVNYLHRGHVEDDIVLVTRTTQRTNRGHEKFCILRKLYTDMMVTRKVMQAKGYHFRLTRGPEMVV
jgi:hypothetical protein